MSDNRFTLSSCSNCGETTLTIDLGRRWCVRCLVLQLQDFYSKLKAWEQAKNIVTTWFVKR